MEPGQAIGAAERHGYRVAFPRRYWYPACQSAALGHQPVGITMMGTPIVLFRDRTGHPRALLNRCPHRNLALSLGRVRPDGCVECAYHGWRFDGSGRCVAVPGLLLPSEPQTVGSSSRDVEAYAAREQDGFVWVWGDPGAPDGSPIALPSFQGRGCGQVVLSSDLECSLHAAIENALDVPHTAFLHRGLFRGGDAKEIHAQRRELPGGTEVRYTGEPVRFGPLRAGPLRAGRADLTFDHWDRFLLPSTAQIEYRVEGWLRLTNTIVHLPLSPFRTRAWFVLGYWTRLPASVVRPIIVAQGRRILRQDAGVLAEQTDNIRRFGGAKYTSTDLDLLGNSIWRLLRQAERAEIPDRQVDDTGGDRGEEPPGTDTVTFRA